MFVRMTAVFYLSLSFLSAVAIAQDEASPGGFFDKGFAEGGSILAPEEATAQAERKPNIPTTRSTPLKPRATATAIGGGFFDPPPSENSPAPTAIPGPGATPTMRSAMNPPLPIAFVSAVINGANRDHLQSALGELRQVSAERKLKVGPVFIVGSLQAMGNQDLQNLIVQLPGVPWSVVPEVPRQFAEMKIAASPTWILQTKEGRVVLEAPDSLAKLLTAKGEYIRD